MGFSEKWTLELDLGEIGFSEKWRRGKTFQEEM